ncbi:GNAT family N-acetyltransferase [Photorhabdus luminescens]|uniref:GNAT family N-acetyltransferase n=1 Tax=Photorhabdus luminescens subsp. sonorensis TaxID=1173677 RepID=A0A5C4RN44_PHOLU|nr:GNAT family N-acetyltransferase [Photorhabdus luminescens]TNH45189.1 GNAT family N-acetyltransferase [Photorhabdus luminescens subsp. sonorensis]
MFKLEPLDKNHYDNWNKIIINAKNGNFLFLIDYFKYHENRFTDASLIIYKKQIPVAVFPANINNGAIYSHSGLTYGGLIYGKELHAKDILFIFNIIKEYYLNGGYNKIIYKCIPDVFKKYPSNEDLYALFINRAKLIRRDLSSVIEIKECPKLSELRKRSIKKAAKNNIIINQSENFYSFHKLLSNVLSKFGTKPVHSSDEMKLLSSRFPENIKLYTAIKDNSLIAGCIIYDFGHIVHTQYLASNEIGRNTGALDAILNHLINSVYHEKKYFSFGISTENSGYYLNEGLISQKEGFGGRGVTHDFYEWDLNNS